MDRPVIFLSAVSNEFRELRQLLHDSFKTHFHVITQDDTLHKFPSGNVRQLLSDAIDGSHAVLHLTGAGFGSTAAAPFPEMPGFLCSWTQYEYYYAHSFDADPVHRKQIFAIVCGPTLRSPTFTEEDDATLTSAQKAPLQKAHCQRIFSGKFDATPLASLPRTVNHGQPINDNAAALRAAIDICAQLATRQPAFQSACALVQVSLQEQLQPLLDAQLRIEKKQKRLLFLSLCTLAALALIGGGVFWLKKTTDETSSAVKTVIVKQEKQNEMLLDHGNLLKTAVAQLEKLTEEKAQLGIKITDLPREEVEKELAARVGVSAVELRLNIEAGQKSKDALVRARANLLANKLDEAISAAEEVEKADSAVIARLIEALGIKAQAHYQKAEYEKALTARQRIVALIDFQAQPLAWADAQHEVAVILYVLAHHSEAVVLLQQVISIKERELGYDDPSLVTSLNNLAELYRVQGKLADAEPLFRRTIEIGEAKLGKDHPDIVTRLNNLANVLQEQGKSAEAEPLYRRTIEIGEAKLGKDHPSVATRLNNLALLLGTQGKLAEAEPLFRRSIEIGEARLGKDHPDVATRLNNLANLLKAQGKLTEAELLYRRCIEIGEAKLGKDHTDVAIWLNNLAVLLQAQGKLAEAEPLYRRALEIDEAKLGKDHLNVAVDLYNFASFKLAQGKLAEAEPLYRQALGIVFLHRKRNGTPFHGEEKITKSYTLLLEKMQRTPEQMRAEILAIHREAGLEPAAFEALWAEALAANFAGPFLVTVDEAVTGGQGIALGIQPGDVILRYHGQAITSIAQLIQLTGEVKDEAIPLEIQRGKEILKLTAKPGKLGVKIQNVMPPAPAE